MAAERRDGRTDAAPGWLLRLSIIGQLVLLALVVVVPMLGAVVYAASVGRSNAGSAAERTSLQMAALAASNVSAFIADVEAEMRVVAARPLIRAADGSHCDPFLDELLALRPYLANAGVVDLSGQVICSAVDAPPGGLPSVADTAWFQEVERTGRFTVGEPYLGPITGRLVALFVMPVESGGQRTGYLTLPLDLVRFQRALEGLAGVSEAIVGVVSDSGQIVARSAEAERFVGESIGDERLAQLRDGGTATMTGVDGVRRIYARAPIAGTSWFVGAGIPVSVAYGDSNRLGSTLVAVSAGLLVLGLGTAVVVGRGIARPVRALATRAEEVARGEPFRELALTGPREVAAAAGWFNHMVEFVSASRAERERVAGEMIEMRDRAARQQVELLERLAAAEDAERERIAHGIHDDTIQNLSAANLGVESLARGLVAGRISSDAVVGRLTEITDALQAAAISVRQVVFDLAPPDVTGDLIASVRALADNLFAETATDAEVEVAGDSPVLDPRQTRLVYRIVAEALRNARYHAEAATVAVSFEQAKGELVVFVIDDGRGVPGSGPETRPGHLGVRAMNERAQVLGGTCTVTRRPEGGTTVMLRFRVRPPAPAENDGPPIAGNTPPQPGIETGAQQPSAPLQDPLG